MCFKSDIKNGLGMAEKFNGKFAKKPLILVVDDVVKNLQVIANMLIDTGYEISVALNGRQAIDTAKVIKPDLILLDIMMPELDGFEVCKVLKDDSETSDIPIVFLTAKNEMEDILRAFNSGGVDFITKPFQRAEILARIETHLELKFSREIIQNHANEVEMINSRLKDEIVIAAEYFTSLLPLKLNDEYIETDWKYVPSAELGGDAFGYFWLDSDNFVFYLLDVCGHGVASALFSTSVQNTLRFQILPNTDFRDPKSVFTGLNKVFQMPEHHDMFFTIWYGSYNKKTRELKYASAGHHPSILISPGQSAEFISAPNFIIGAEPEYDFIQDSIIMPNDTLLYLFTDGTFEFKKVDGFMNSIYDTKDYIANNCNNNELNRLYLHIRELSGLKRLKDDYTILKIKFK